MMGAEPSFRRLLTTEKVMEAVYVLAAYHGQYLSREGEGVGLIRELEKL